MNTSYQFILSTIDKIKDLEDGWIASLTNTHDDMWLSFARNANTYLICYGAERIGFTSVDAEQQLLRYYLPEHQLHHAAASSKALISELGVSKAVISSGDPNAMTALMSVQHRVSVHSFLFQHAKVTELPPIDGLVSLASAGDLDTLCEYFHRSMGAPKPWLKGYVSERISRQELFVFYIDEQIAGTFEVRRHSYHEEVVELGMVVAADFRNGGLGTYLLHLATKKALAMGKVPICSCESNNPGSYKAIIKNGFVAKYQMLELGL